MSMGKILGAVHYSSTNEVLRILSFNLLWICNRRCDSNSPSSLIKGEL